MNKQDRDKVQELAQTLESLKGQIQACGEELRALADAEQEKFDNLSEGLQAAEQGQQIEQCAGTLDEAASAAEDGNAAEAIEALENL